MIGTALLVSSLHQAISRERKKELRRRIWRKIRREFGEKFRSELIQKRSLFFSLQLPWKKLARQLDATALLCPCVCLCLCLCLCLDLESSTPQHAVSTSLSLSLSLSRSSTRRNSTLASRHQILLFVLEYLLQVIPTYLGTAHQFFNIFEPALFDWGSVSQKYKSLDTRA